MKTLRVARAIGWVTFLEIVRDKILYNVLLCTFLLFGVGWLASRLDFLRPDRIILDFGLASVGISSSVIAVLVGSGLLARELERRTIYVALSHPISRAQFVFGKFVGLSAVLAVNWILISISYLGLLFLSSESGLGIFSSTLFIAILLLLIQSLLLAAIAILFSTFSTTSLSVIFSLGFYLIGSNISQIRMVAVGLHSSVGSFIVNSLATLLPNFEHFNLGAQVTYGLPVTGAFISLSILYGLSVIGICLFLAGILIQTREV